MKDKIKNPKIIDDDTNIREDVGFNDLNQCAYCKSLFSRNIKHYCKIGYVCSICGHDIKKKPKESESPIGHKYYSFRTKKTFKIADKLVCWNCVFNLVKQFKRYNL